MAPGGESISERGSPAERMRGSCRSVEKAPRPKRSLDQDRLQVPVDREQHLQRPSSRELKYRASLNISIRTNVDYFHNCISTVIKNSRRDEVIFNSGKGLENLYRPLVLQSANYLR
jgi:hypothetical protein